MEMSVKILKCSIQHGKLYALKEKMNRCFVEKVKLYPLQGQKEAGNA